MFQAGYVNIFGKPNAGKSTLMNALLGEKLAIISDKVQTTRHRIKGIINEPGYQIILSDTPGIIEPKYKLHEKMMMAVKGALEDADVGLLLVDGKAPIEEQHQIFVALRLKVPCIVVINKLDILKPAEAQAMVEFFTQQPYAKQVLSIAALKKNGLKELLDAILKYLPEGDPFYDTDDLTDLPTKFFVGEMIREKIYHLYKDEIPYHTAVMVNEFKEKTTLIKIVADIVVQRDTQKGILLGEGGKMIRQLGTEARKDIEQFLGQKVFLELFVKVKPKWRDNDLMLREYGY
ncbi:MULTISPECIES: GTPase Era [unclassified Paraflavitalea]|uniref:GTPase Era n=1 Tax=unclassified Paraflavitalea TaxID=2798305 RepID=UPI003D3456EF